jgi:hypothetical protein
VLAAPYRNEVIAEVYARPWARRRKRKPASLQGRRDFLRDDHVAALVLGISNKGTSHHLESVFIFGRATCCTPIVSRGKN